LVGKKKGAGLAHFVARHIEIEPMVFRVVQVPFLVVCLEVPLADMGGGVAVLFKGFSEGQVFAGHVALYCGGIQAVLRALGSCTPTMVGEPDPARVFARENAGPSGGAYGVGRIGVVKKYTVPSESIEPWSFVKRAAGKAEVGVA